jgi:hypothetical protein
VSDDLMDNMDDEFIESEFDDGFIIMNEEEFIAWNLAVEYEDEPYGDC